MKRVQHQARPSLRLWARDEALADDLAAVVSAAGSDVERVDASNLVERAAACPSMPCLIEAAALLAQPERDRLLAALDDAAEVILVGDAGQRESLAHWQRSGQAFFLSLPLDRDYLAELLRDIVSEQGQRGGSARSTSPPALDQYGLLYGSSDVMRELYRHLRKAARTDATLLICGESGTGKELIARSVHSYSARAEEGFEGINCGAIPAELLESELFGHEKGSFTGADRAHRGLFERAGRGTLFLDEITEMPLAAQTRLLRVLETGRFRRVGGQTEQRCEARLMAASNRDPLQAIETGELRQDLYYRICQMEIVAPALRQRGDDVLHLARLFARLYSQKTGLAVRLDAAAEGALRQHDWPGNVRELRHCILSAARLSRGTIRVQDLENAGANGSRGDGGGEAGRAGAAGAGGDGGAEEASTRLRAGMRIADAERRLIELTLRETDGNKERAARLLGISVRTLYNRLRRYEQEPGAAAQ